MTVLYARDEDYQRQKQERGLKETEWEMTKKQRQHQTRNRHENGAYYQAAWQKLADGYIALYGTTPIQIRSLPKLNDIFEDEEG